MARKKEKKPKKQPPVNYYALLFGEEDCCPDEDITPEEITEGLQDWQMMLEHFIALHELHPNDNFYKEEIASIRRSIQAEKIRKRGLLANVI